jgi:type II secretory pathway pseudopilin PulG
MTCRTGRGISLVEVLLVLLVLGLAAAAAIPRMVYSSESKGDECAANVALMNARLDAYYAKTGGRMPADQAEFNRLILSDTEKFPNGLPKCPCGRPYEYDRATGHVIAHQH